MAVRDLPKTGKAPKQSPQPAGNGVTMPDGGYTAVEGNGAAAPRVSMRQNAAAGQTAAAAIGAPIANFEGLSNQDNFNAFGFRVNPPDPVGDVGPNHYVEMINLVFAVYSKTGTLLAGPTPIGTLWAGFAIETAPIRRATRSSSTTSSPTAGSSRQFTTAAGTTRPVLQLRRDLDDRRPDRHLLPVRVHHAAGHWTAGTSPTTRSTASGPTRT